MLMKHPGWFTPIYEKQAMMMVQTGS